MNRLVRIEGGALSVIIVSIIGHQETHDCRDYNRVAGKPVMVATQESGRP